jgi:hypothetical protein
MFNEVVSLAIIVSFILNIIFVDHPNTSSYTIYFVIGLAVICPPIFGWKYRKPRRETMAAGEMGPEENVPMRVARLADDLEAGHGSTETDPKTDSSKVVLGIGDNNHGATEGVRVTEGQLTVTRTSITPPLYGLSSAVAEAYSS